jgi:tetratricopeptide repeat protein
MSGLIAKANKRRSTAPQKARANKSKKPAAGKKAATRKPLRPGKITAKPKLRKAAAASKASSLKKKPVSPKKPAAARPGKRLAKKHTVTKASGKKVSVVASRGKKKSKITARVLSRSRTLVIKPAPAPPKKPPSPGALAAVRAFEHALRVFNRHNFDGAKTEFEGILEKFGEQAEVVARVRTYLTICDQRLTRTQSAPRNADALYNQGVFELNRGSIREAIALFDRALKIEPRADHVFYSLAAAYARLNETPKAIDALRRATTIRPVHRSHARRDLDFASLRSNEDFQQLTGFGFDLIEE